MKPLPPFIKVLGVVALLLIFSDSKGCNLIGQPPAFPTKLPVAVAIAYDATPTAVQQFTKDYPDVVGTVQDWVKTKGGEFRLIDTRHKEKPSMDADWVQAAWDAIDKEHPPTIIAASANSGIKSQPLPKSPEEVLKLLNPLVK